MEQPEKKPKDPIWKHAKITSRTFKTAEELWDAAVEYFKWCDDNPVDAPINVIRYKKEKHGGSKEMKKQDQQENITRPYTLYGLCAFIGVPKWYKMKEMYSDKGEDFDNVIMTIENVIASQQIDGALTGVFRENLAARLNGLADRNQQEISGEVDVKNEHKFNGFGFLPYTPNLPNSEQAQIASGEVVEDPDPIYAEVIDYVPADN